MRRCWLLVLLVVVAAAGGALAVWQRSGPNPPPERPFADLTTAIASEGPHGWELHIPPPHPGPYRLLPGGPVLGRAEGTGLTCRVRDNNGMVLEELALRGTPEYDQAVMYLETPGGRRTMAALKRAR